MSSNDTRPCKHCGRSIIPVNHMCDGKSKAIAEAAKRYEQKAEARPKQRWNDSMGWERHANI